jgi:hypothetical protein
MVQSRFANVTCSEELYYYSDLLRHDVAVFDSAGTFLRTIGRDGAGPGEFRQAVPLLVDTDTLYVFDRPNGRYSVITTRDSIARIVPFTNVGGENPFSIALLADRRVVVNGLRRDHGSDSLLPLHVVDHLGRIQHSFGDRTFTAIDIRRPSPPFLRVVARAVDAGFWSAHRFQYRVDKWTSDGRLERTLTVEAEWFPPEPIRSPNNGLDFGPASGVAIKSVVETEAGLWVVIGVPDGETMIQLLDPQTGDVRASTRLNARIDRFACQNVLVSTVHDQDGYPYLQIWRLRVAF